MRRLFRIVLLSAIIIGAGQFSLAEQALALAKPPFADIAKDLYRKEILRLWARGVVAGFPDGFRPGEKVTRAQMARFVNNVENISEETGLLQGVKSPFRDVADNHWAKGDILLCEEQSLMVGYPGGYFRPEEEIPRYQVALILLRGLGEMGKPSSSHLAGYQDADEIPFYARPYVARALELGLLKPAGPGITGALEPALRSETAAALHRFLELRGDLFDISGKLVSYNPAKLSLVLEVEGREETFSLAENCLNFLAENEQGNPLPAYASLILDKEGKVALLEQGGGPAETFRLLVESRVLPSGIRNEEKKGPLAAGEKRGPISRENPVLSLKVTKAEINGDRLAQELAVDGADQLIAIIDTGVDVAHPDLQWTTRGEPKIAGWLDLTKEGEVPTPHSLKAFNQKIRVEDREYRLGNLQSKSQVYRLGFLETLALLPPDLLEYDAALGDFKNEKIAVLLLDAEVPGQYNAVVLDLNQNQDFSDDRVLGVYSADPAYVTLHKRDRPFSLVVAEIGEKGDYVKFGFDGNGHGTHVAGIAAANGEVKGIAPGARLLVIKAIEMDGLADWDKIEEAVLLAASRGAGIINLSLGRYQDDTAGKSSLALLVNKLSREKNIIFTIAAGNTGPGLSSLATPADADEALSVGAYISPLMWEVDYGWKVEKETLWYFSSVGPRKDGAWFPALCAPGSAISAVPLWKGEKYGLVEGSSMASPHVAGAVALLQEAAQKQGLPVTSRELKTALLQGARYLPHMEAAAQGRGVLDIYKAWHLLKEGSLARETTVRAFNADFGTGRGVLAREFAPGRLYLEVINESRENKTILWDNDLTFARVDRKKTYLPAGKARKVPVTFSLEKVESGLISGDDPSSPGKEVQIPVTAGKTLDLAGHNGYKQAVLSRLDAGRYERWFVRVPEGTESLEAALSVFPDTGGKYQGRARLHLFDPWGREVEMSGYAGAGPDGEETKGRAELYCPAPQPGTWEIVVYSSATLSLYDLAASHYQLELSLHGVPERGASNFQDKYLLTCQGTCREGEYGFLALQIRDRQSKKPVSGLLEINGRAYEIHNGKLVLPARCSAGETTVTATLWEGDYLKVRN